MAPEILPKLWPSLCKAACVKELDMPPTDVVMKMLPFVVAAARASKNRDICLEIMQMPSNLYLKADSNARAMIERKIDEWRRAGIFTQP
jgi:hypothetical protein